MNEEENIFTQTNDLEKYDNPLASIYENLIVPAMNEDIQGVPNFKWEQTLCQGSSALARCDYDTYELLKVSGNRTTHRNDSITYSYPNHDSISDSLDEAINILGKEISCDYLGLSNHPTCYRDHEGYDGYMGWHTNHDFPGDRWYFVYNTEPDRSFFRYIDPDTGQMETAWEPAGWCLNHFVAGNYQSPLWHCIYTSGYRFSFGIRKIELLKYTNGKLNLR